MRFHQGRPWKERTYTPVVGCHSVHRKIPRNLWSVNQCSCAEQGPTTRRGLCTCNLLCRHNLQSWCSQTMTMCQVAGRKSRPRDYRQGLLCIYQPRIWHKGHYFGQHNRVDSRSCLQRCCQGGTKCQKGHRMHRCCQDTRGKHLRRQLDYISRQGNLSIFRYRDCLYTSQLRTESMRQHCCMVCVQISGFR